MMVMRSNGPLGDAAMAADRDGGWLVATGAAVFAYVVAVAVTPLYFIVVRSAPRVPMPRGEVVK